MVERKRLATVLIALLCIGGVFAEVAFSDLDLAAESRLLFQARTDVPGQDPYSTLFYADLKSGEFAQLSFFPEEFQLLAETKQLQIQNRFGVFRTDKNLASLAPIGRFPSFVNGKQISSGRIFPIQASPDGRFLLFLDPNTPAYADLVLMDLVAGKEEVISRRVELSLGGPMAVWSPNSKFFVYAKTGKLYYFSIEQYLGGRVLSENFRGVGEGAVSSVQWGPSGDLYYIAGSLVYQILGVELFTRSLYQNVLRIGKITGKLPFDFDPNFDSFWIAPDGRKMLLNKAGRNIFLYHLSTEDFLSTGETLSLPYLYLPRNTRVRTVLWSADDVITMLAGSLERGNRITAIYRINLREKATAFSKSEDKGVNKLVLSPDGRRAALLSDNAVSVRSYDSWKEERSIAFEQPLHAAWVSENELLIGGRYTIQSALVDTGSFKFLGYSQPEKFGFRDGKVQVLTRGIARQYDPAAGLWQAAERFEAPAAQVASSAFRVYLDENAGLGSYRNMVMVRNIQGYGTRPLFNPPKEGYEPFPAEDEPVDSSNFSHGSRIRQREAALVFDAVDSVEGLTEILNTLAEYRVKASFFINGDFIRRNPGAVKELADSGHELGSMFYAYFNMTDPQYQITKEFIKQGLAKNEDEFFAVTGKELTLLWHAPYYFVSSSIIEASREMNYLYVGRDVDALDWVNKRTDTGISTLYLPSADLVERILQLKKPGSIVAMRVGRAGDAKAGLGRDDYLYQKLDLLINLLITRGYSLVPVSGLVDRTR